MPLRTLHLDAGRSWRGGQRQVFLLANALRSRGQEPLVVGVPGSPLLERAQGAGIATASARMRADWDLRSAKRIRSLLRAWRPDIIHAHDARSHAIALLALTGDTTPLVVTRRVTFPIKSARLKYGSRVTHFIAVSHAVKKAMTQSGISPLRIDVVHSGVPLAIARHPRDWRKELGWPRDTVIAGVVGAMTAEKGIDAVRRIVTSLTESASSHTRLVLLGGEIRGPTRFGSIRAYECGFVSEIHDAMAGLDVLWHPAREEGLGTVLIDSLALGVPPVAFAVGGVPEIIENRKTGILVAPGDIQGFAAGHIALMEPEIRREMALGGPARATLFDVERMTRGTEQVYEKILTA